MTTVSRSCSAHGEYSDTLHGCPICGLPTEYIDERGRELRITTRRYRRVVVPLAATPVLSFIEGQLVIELQEEA